MAEPYTPDPAEPYPGAAADRIAALNAFWEVVRKGAAELGIDTADGIDGRLLAAINRGVYASVAALAAAGRLQPAGGETRTQWAVRVYSAMDNSKPGLPYATRDEAEERLQHLLEHRAGRWPATAELLQRDVRYWPDGSCWVGPWQPAPTGDPS